MIISKLTHKTTAKNIDSFEDLVNTNIKIIVKGDTFVEDFFNSSESSQIAKIRGTENA